MSTCHCVDVAPGSYANQVSMLVPFELEHRDDRWVCIDTCIATEIGWLWHHGVVTLNSCCGHQQKPASVIVALGSYDLMDTLGYEWQLAPSGLRAHLLRGVPTTDFPDTSQGSTEGDKDGGVNPGPAGPARGAEHREPRSSGPVIRSGAHCGDRAEDGRLHRSEGEVAEVRGDERAEGFLVTATSITKRIEALTDEWERSSSRQTRMYGHRLRSVLERNK